MLTLTNPFFQVIGDHLTAEAARHGYAATVLSADEDVVKQGNQVKDFIVSGAAAIVLSPCQVEAIGLRVTKMRMLNGSLRVIPNGELTQFANHNKDWARAVVDVGVAYETDVQRALETMERTAAQWARESGQALEPPQAQGIIRFADADLVLRLSIKVRPTARFEAEVGLRRRIKEAFEREGIHLPTPQRVVYLRGEAS